MSTREVSGSRGIHYSRLAWGAVLLALGAVFLMERFELFFLEEYVQYWPLVVIAAVLLGLGALSFTTARGNEGRRTGLWLLGVGGWFLLNALELFGLWFNDSWPLLILLGGVIDLLFPKPGKGRATALWPLAIGLWLLINTLGLWGFYWTDSWPWLLVFLGGALILQATLGRLGRGAV